ncbi:MAG: PASTA domain-containing protein [Pyrinomonadaceae bacterium]
MRFLFGVLVGYSMRGKSKLLITVLTTLVLTVYVIVPAIALLALHLDVQKERADRGQLKLEFAVKGLSYENAETTLHTSNLNIRLLATRGDLPPQPGLIIDQPPQPGEEVDRGYLVSVTVTKAYSNSPLRSAIRFEVGENIEHLMKLDVTFTKCPVVSPAPTDRTVRGAALLRQSVGQPYSRR